jgi:hypothetical protein
MTTARLPKGHRSCLDPAFRYTVATDTDIARTFARIRDQLLAAEAEAKAVAAELVRAVKPLSTKRYS